MVSTMAGVQVFGAGGAARSTTMYRVIRGMFAPHKECVKGENIPIRLESMLGEQNGESFAEVVVLTWMDL
jgi:hypothetical protein